MVSCVPGSPIDCAGDDADGLAEVHHVAARQVAAVAADADALPRLAGQHRADLDPLEARVLDRRLTLSSSISSFALTMTLAVERIADVLERDAAEDAVAEALDDLAALDERRHLDAVERAAVLLGDDRVLRDVDEAAGQVAGVGGLERRVGRDPCGRRAWR
mgnify:CR=1 FL=1